MDDIKSYFIFAHDEQLEQKLYENLPNQFYVQNLQYLVNGHYDLDEVEYLTGLCSQKLTTIDDLQNALFYLQHSQKFSSVQIQIFQKPGGVDLIFQLTKQPILHRISISGFLRGKERLKNSYLIDIGDPFDKQKHQHGVEQVVNFLKDIGFFQAQVTDSVMIDDQTQAVMVKCMVKKGSKFKVRTIKILFDHVGSVSHESIDKLQQHLQAFCISKMQGRSYSSKLI